MNDVFHSWGRGTARGKVLQSFSYLEAVKDVVAHADGEAHIASDTACYIHHLLSYVVMDFHLAHTRNGDIVEEEAHRMDNNLVHYEKDTASLV